MKARLFRVWMVLGALGVGVDGYDIIPLVYRAQGFAHAVITVTALTLLIGLLFTLALDSYTAAVSSRGPLGGTAT